MLPARAAMQRCMTIISQQQIYEPDVDARTTQVRGRTCTFDRPPALETADAHGTLQFDPVICGVCPESRTLRRQRRSFLQGTGSRQTDAITCALLMRLPALVSGVIGLRRENSLLRAATHESALERQPIGSSKPIHPQPITSPNERFRPLRLYTADEQLH